MRIMMIAAGVLLSVAAVTAEWTQRSEDVRAATWTVNVTSSPNAFVPQNITITAGDTVTWTFGGTHDVTSADSPPSFTGSGTLGNGATYSVTFNTPGTFIYYCSLHAVPSDYPNEQTGRIIVQAAPTNTATATNTVAAATATATRTPTRTATGTPQATATPSTPAVTPLATTAAPSAATVTPAGGAAPSVGAPSTGDGGASQGGGSSHALSLALAAMGAALIAGAMAVRRRA